MMDSKTMTSLARGSGHWLIDMEAYRKNIEWASAQADRVKALIMELGGATWGREKIREILLAKQASNELTEPACTLLDTLCRSLEMGGSPGQAGSGGRAEAATEAADLILEICESFRFSRRVGHQD